MAIEIVMPALEMAQERGLLVRWLKTEGDFVQKGEPLMEIETDKALMEIESPDSGILSDISAKPGDAVPVGQVIAHLLPDSGQTSKIEPAINIETGSYPTVQQPVTERAKQEKVPTPGCQVVSRMIPASPKARRMAAELKLDLRSIKGSGPYEAKLARDVLNASTQPS